MLYDGVILDAKEKGNGDAMSYVTDVLQTVLPVMVVLLIGVFCRRRGVLSREGIAALKDVAVNIALPAVLINAFATTSYSFRNVLIPVLMFGICVLGWALGKASCRFLKLQDVFLPYLTTGFEAGMLGYTLFGMLYGSEEIAAFAIVDLGQVLFVFTLYKILLNREFTEEQDGKGIVKSLVTSPIILAICVGVLLGATGLYEKMVSVGISPIFDEVVSFVAAPTSVLILLSIGYDLVFDSIPWKKVLGTVGIRFVIMMILLGVVSLAFHGLFPGDTALLRAARVMFILPPPYVLPIFADDETEYTYLSSVLTVYTLLSILCFGVMAVFKL